mgnify:CR=1 FL=1
MSCYLTIPVLDTAGAETGRLAGTGTLNIGLAVGPLIGSQIVSAFDFQALLYFCNLLYVVALISMCCAFYALKSPKVEEL